MSTTYVACSTTDPSQTTHQPIHQHNSGDIEDGRPQPSTTNKCKWSFVFPSFAFGMLCLDILLLIILIHMLTESNTNSTHCVGASILSACITSYFVAACMLIRYRKLNYAPSHLVSWITITGLFQILAVGAVKGTLSLTLWHNIAIGASGIMAILAGLGLMVIQYLWGVQKHMKTRALIVNQ